MNNNDYTSKINNIMDKAKEDVRTQIDRAYQQGYADAKSELGQNAVDLAHEESDRAYQRGLEDAWEAAKKITLDKNDDVGLSLREMVQIFHTASYDKILKENTASEAIAKINEYEEQQKQDTEIKVGDEVYSEMNDLRFIVTRIYDGIYEGICTDGAAYCPLPNDVKKTGRHTETILKTLGEFDETD